MLNAKAVPPTPHSILLAKLDASGGATNRISVSVTMTAAEPANILEAVLLASQALPCRSQKELNIIVAAVPS